MRILISNDDGIQSEGLEALVKVFSKNYDVVVAAPANQQSAMGHALTVKKKLYVEEYVPLKEKYGVEAWKIGGTPTDCVKLYLEGMTDKWPDIILSGINHGPNLGTDIIYSGTVGAALEGFIHDINSFAVSLEIDSEFSFDYAAELFAAKLEVLLHQAPKSQLINVNFPKKLKPGYQWLWCDQGKRDYKNAFVPGSDSKGRYYMVGGEIIDSGNGPESDIETILTGNITVTPLLLKVSDTEFVSGRLGKAL